MVWMMIEVERPLHLVRRVGVALPAILAALVMVAGLTALVTLNVQTSADIRKESEESHILSEMQTALTSVEESVSAWQANPMDTLHPAANDAVTSAIAGFEELGAELISLIDANEIAEVRVFVDAFSEYVDEILLITADLEVPDLQRLNALGLNVRSPLLELLEEENDHLVESVEADQRSATALRWGFPILLVLGIASLGFVSRLQRRSRQLDEERRVNDARSRFIASVSHELRTPLTPVVALSHELRDRVGDFSQAEIGEFANVIAKESDEVARIVADLLVAARIETGELAIAPEVLEIRLQIDQALTTVVGPAAVAIDATGSVLADSGRLRQILRNLMSNAEHYGGQEIKVTSKRLNEMVQITVSDSGPGIPMELRERIFEPYASAHESRGVPASVGLGLAVSRSLAVLMGGTLDYSFDDGWSRFNLVLPAGSEA